MSAKFPRGGGGGGGGANPFSAIRLHAFVYVLQKANLLDNLSHTDRCRSRHILAVDTDDQVTTAQSRIFCS